MASLSIVEYMHDLKAAGFTDKQSEVQARRLELIVAEVKSDLKTDLKQELHADDLVTKADLSIAVATTRKDLELAVATTRKDLELAIEKIRYDALKFTIWTGVAVVVAIGSMLAKGFHWL